MGSGAGDWERIVAFWRVLEMIEPRDIPRATPAREKREPGTDFVEAIELRPGQAVPPLPWQEGHRRLCERAASRSAVVWRPRAQATTPRLRRPAARHRGWRCRRGPLRRRPGP